MKRFVEVVIATGILFVCAPLLLIFTAAIRLTTPGPVLTRHRYEDAQGRSFDVYGFQTPANFIGYWLRRLNLDTLPQLINVLRGKMSLIGPPLDR